MCQYFEYGSEWQIEDFTLLWCSKTVECFVDLIVIRQNRKINCKLLRTAHAWRERRILLAHLSCVSRGELCVCWYYAWSADNEYLIQIFRRTGVEILPKTYSRFNFVWMNFKCIFCEHSLPKRFFELCSNVFYM